jgi:hypothetical protein
VELLVPPLPEAWAPLPGIRLFLTWRDVAGNLREREVLPGSLTNLELPRGRRRSLLVEARYRGRPLRAAGTLYPDWSLAVSGGIPLMACRLEATWKDGWTAAVARYLEEGGEGAAFDYSRLRAEATSRLADPWDLDPRVVARRLADRSFRSDLLRLPPAVVCTLPDPGPWVAESPFSALAQPVSGGFQAEIRPGLRHWFSPELELFVVCAEGGEPILLLRPLLAPP